MAKWVKSRSWSPRLAEQVRRRLRAAEDFDQEIMLSPQDVYVILRMISILEKRNR